MQQETAAAHQKFVHSCKNLRVAQNRLLVDIVNSNCQTLFGKRHQFGQITTASDPVQWFQNAVSQQNYASLKAELDLQTEGKPALLADEILFYERTGGSSGGSKIIPFTSSALLSLQSAVEPWLHDLSVARPALSAGTAYWSVSPAMNSGGFTPDGTRIGSDSDLEFLSENLQGAIFSTMVSPAAIQTAKDYEHWQRLTLLTLLMQSDLRLISIWSPTFMTTLLRAMPGHIDWLTSVLVDPAEQGLEKIDWLGNSVTRKEALERLITINNTNDQGVYSTRKLWPELDTISCWTHGPASGYAAELEEWFSGVYIQPKGLMATEGVMTIPLQGADYPVLAVNSGFFEFVDKGNNVLLPEQLDIGVDYRILITNSNGFYRYEIGDIVCMRGFYHEAPMLEFKGRSGNVSDLVGEKLEESFVSGCIASFAGAGMLVAAANKYYFYTDSTLVERDVAEQWAVQLELQLQDNPQYRYARELGQLESVQPRQVEDLAQLYTRWRNLRGQSIGDIKPVSLCIYQEFARQLEEKTV